MEDNDQENRLIKENIGSLVTCLSTCRDVVVFLFSTTHWRGFYRHILFLLVLSLAIYFLGLTFLFPKICDQGKGKEKTAQRINENASDKESGRRLTIGWPPTLIPWSRLAQITGSSFGRAVIETISLSVLWSTNLHHYSLSPFFHFGILLFAPQSINQKAQIRK